MHRHKYNLMFAKDKGRIAFYECDCGARKVRASADARKVDMPLGWPKPKLTRRKNNPGTTVGWG